MKNLALVLALAACSSTPTMPEYTAARADALKSPPPVSKDWKPDASLQLSAPLVADLVAVGLDQYGAIDDPVKLDGGATITPDLKVTKVTLGSAPTCPTCLDVSATVDGNVAYSYAGLKGRTALKASISVVLDVTAADAGAGTWKVDLSVKDVTKVNVLNSRLPASMTTAVDKGLLEAVKKQLTTYAKPQTIAEFTPEEMPLLAVRTGTTRNGVRIDMLTAASTPTPLGKVPDKLRSGWQFSVQTDSLLDLARKTSFEQGVITWDVVAEPRALRMGRGTYEMDLRLWMISGAGWWRDYSIKGEITRKDDGFVLSTADITKTGMSEGAATVDPLAAIGESQIVDNIALSLNASLPGTQSGAASGLKADVTVQGVYGANNMVQVRGDLAISKHGNR